MQLFGAETDSALYRTGIVLPLLAIVWFASRVRALGGERALLEDDRGAGSPIS
jgi:hypothetical protein